MKSMQIFQHFPGDDRCPRVQCQCDPFWIQIFLMKILQHPTLKKKDVKRNVTIRLIIKRASFTREKRWKDVIRCATISVIIKTFSFPREKSVELYISPSLFWSLFAFSFKVFEEYSMLYKTYLAWLVQLVTHLAFGISIKVDKVSLLLQSIKGTCF